MSELPQLVDVRCGHRGGKSGRWAHVEVQCTCGRVSRDEFVCPACLSPLSRTGTRITPDHVALKRGDEIILRGEDA